MCTLVHDYFTSIFTERQGDQQSILSCVHPRVSDVDNYTLTQPFSEQEFKEAIFSMHPDKSPGPDSLSPAFFHIFWIDIGGDIFTSATSWLSSGSKLHSYCSRSKRGQSRINKRSMSYISLQCSLQNYRQGISKPLKALD